MKLNWIGEGLLYGLRLQFFSITSFNVEQIYYIYKVSDVDSDNVFNIRPGSDVNKKLINIEYEIDEDIDSVYLIQTDEEFRKKFKRSYNIMKFASETEVLTIGIYNDTGQKMTDNNSYLLCTRDFINILAEAEKINSYDQIKDTPFEEMGPLFNKNELTKQLLK